MIARTTAVAGILLASLVLVSPAADASTVHVRFENGRLTVVGSDAGNTIVITRKARAVRVKVDGKRIRIGKPIKPRRLKEISVQGRGGNDTVRLVESAGRLPRANLNGGPGNDQLTGGSATTTLIGGPGSDRLTGGSGATAMIGGNDDDVLVAGAGPATMDAGGGNDTAEGGSGSTTADLGPGDDTFHGGTGPVVVDGGVGRDNLGAGLSVSAQLSGSADEDTLVGGPGTAELFGEGARDTLTAGTGPTRLSGGDGDDVLWAGAQTSQIAGDLGDDTFRIDPAVVQGPLSLVVTDFGTAADTVDLVGALAVHTGLGTTTVTIWDGVTDVGTITAGNGRLWQAGDFS